MVNQILDRVTLTGANQRTDIRDMHRISQEYPFVEWGILLSRNAMGAAPRFPGRVWLNDMVKYKVLDDGRELNLAGHLCGQWVRDICKGDWTFLQNLGEDVVNMFGRIQLNFHALVHDLNQIKFIRGFTSGPGKRYAEGRQFIFQLDDVNNEILDIAKDAGINAVPLFDLSGGAGVLPEAWPTSRGYSGYAGGLSPKNVQEQLKLIQQSVIGDSTAWIDVETHVRSHGDRDFDMQKVEDFVKNAAPWVKGTDVPLLQAIRDDGLEWATEQTTYIESRKRIEELEDEVKTLKDKLGHMAACEGEKE